MRVCIMGWYGTETLGDRAILDGIVRIFAAFDRNLDIHVASLFPFFTERTIFEDTPLYNRSANEINLSTFDAFDKHILHNEIKASDMVIMGGGPLMELQELFIILHAFRYAKRCGIKTALVGCGYGPLKNEDYIACVSNIMHFTDVAIMRSTMCAEKLKSISLQADAHRIFSSLDPAVISVMQYAASAGRNCDSTGSWIMNIRDLDYVYGTADKYYPMLKDAVSMIAEQVDRLVLLPMHSFSVGGDDRIIQNRVRFDLNRTNIEVLQVPPSLVTAYDMIIGADGGVGMRYHSIVFQSILNGNNYILDYTQEKEGKISAFLNDFDKDHFYSRRYVNLLLDAHEFPSICVKRTASRFQYNSDQANDCINLYIKYIFNAGKVIV